MLLKPPALQNPCLLCSRVLTVSRGNRATSTVRPATPPDWGGGRRGEEGGGGRKGEGEREKGERAKLRREGEVKIKIRTH